MSSMVNTRAGGIRRRAALASMLAGTSVLLLMLFPVADAVAPDLVTKLRAGLTCAEPAVSARLRRNVDASGASPTDILEALDELSIAPKVCVQIKDAASALAMELSQATSAQDTTATPDTTDATVAIETDEAAAAQARLEQVLREADQRAASMRFEVGPPPPRLTRLKGEPG